MINFLECRVCEIVFPLCDFKTCCYHPQSHVTDSDVDGVERKIYPCCEQPAVLFEAIRSSSKGCQYCDHKIDFSLVDNSDSNTDTGVIINSADVYSELLNVIDVVCIPRQPDVSKSSSCYNLDSMIKTELFRINVRSGSICREEKRDRRRPPSQKSLLTKKQSFSSKYKPKPDSAEEDNSDIDQQDIVRVVIHQKGPLSMYKNMRKTWNTELPFRLNQDMQRESDLKRMNDLLKDLRISKSSNNVENADKADSVESGGIFHQLETKMKLNMLNTSTSTNAVSSRRVKHIEK